MRGLSSSRRAVLSLVSAAVVIGVAATIAVSARAGPAGHPTASCPFPWFGVLEADPTFLAADGAAGVCFATLTIDWAKWQPAPHTVDAAYRAAEKRAAAGYRAAGWKLAVDAGLQQPPSWVLSLPGGRLVDQHGVRSRTADFEFSAAVRAAAATYLDDLVKSMGPVDDYRIGLSEHGEALYPRVSANGWWTFGPALGERTVLPAGVTDSPLPGWVPGDTEWNGVPLRFDQVTAWYDWYFAAMVNAHAWEMATFRHAGFRGDLELVMPGTGALPTNYLTRLSEDLAPDDRIDSYSTMNTAAVWWKLLDELGTPPRVVVDISSVYDASGSPRGNACRAGDAAVVDTDPQILDWSDTRWLTYLAAKHRLAVMGENPGDTPARDLPGVTALVETCHLAALQWAWDYSLRGDRSSATLTQVAAALAGTRPAPAG